MSISPRTKTLIDRLPDHPLSPSMEAAMVAALAAAEQFAGHRIALASDRRMTELGRRQALQEALTQNHGKALARAKAPVEKARKEITARRAALVVKPADKTDVAGALERQEIRAWVRSLEIGVRQSVVLATSDRRILEAMLTAPPELSGIANAKAAAEIENRYIEIVYPSELTSIEAADAVVSEAEMACNVARNELRSVMDAIVVEVESADGVTRHELRSVADNPRAFDELMKPVETVRPWLIDDRRQVCETGADGKPSYRPANETDLAFGVEYENFEAYKAAQGLAA